MSSMYRSSPFRSISHVCKYKERYHTQAHHTKGKNSIFLHVANGDGSVNNNGSPYSKPKETKGKARKKEATKESNVRLLHLWSTWTSCKRLQNNSLQCARNTTRTDTGRTGQWYDQPNGYDPYWYSNDITGYANNQNYTQQQLALPPPQQQTQGPQENATPTIHFISTVTPSDKSRTTAFVNAIHNNIEAEIRLTGAATHACPTRFAQDSPLHTSTRNRGRA